MDFYVALGQQIFNEGEYSVTPIRFEDRFLIMKWRNEQIYHLRQDKVLTTEDQDNYFNNVIAKEFNEDRPSQILFSFLKNGCSIGYGGLVHINWIDKHAEISFIMQTELELKYFHTCWIHFLKMLGKVSFSYLGLHKIFTYAFDLRPHLYIALQEAGFKKEATLKEHCFFENKYIDVVIHSKINNIGNV